MKCYLDKAVCIDWAGFTLASLKLFGALVLLIVCAAVISYYFNKWGWL